MSRVARTVVVVLSVVTGFWLGAQVEGWYFCESADGACIPILGGTLGAIAAGVVAGRLTDPRRRPKTYDDPDVEAEIRERKRRWTP